MVVVELGQRRRGEDEEKEKEKATNIKSNNPHLAGGNHNQEKKNILTENLTKSGRKKTPSQTQTR